MNIQENYQSLQNLIEDPAQSEVIDEFAKLQKKLSLLNQNKSFLDFFKKEKKVKGIYLWGDVGRGKTFIMDIFFSSIKNIKKNRLHYHYLMSEIHEQLKKNKNKKNPIEAITNSIGQETKILCIDEFFVEDIADAMILGKLLKGLFENRVVLVMTSNSEPKDLYKEGLQRDRFKEAIGLIEENMSVINIGNGPDHRMRNHINETKYHAIHDKNSHNYFSNLIAEKSPLGTEKNALITINNRKIKSILKSKIIIWFDFNTICGTNRSVSDYISIAKQFQNVFISEIPILDSEKENEARRFISLIDEFYERKVKVFITTAVNYKKLYTGKKLTFEFKRTESRLTEMSTEEYQKLRHIH